MQIFPSKRVPEGQENVPFDSAAVHCTYPSQPDVASVSFDPDGQTPHEGSTVGAELGGGVGAFVGSGDFVGDIEDDGCKEGRVDNDDASDVVCDAVGTD